MTLQGLLKLDVFGCYGLSALSLFLRTNEDEDVPDAKEVDDRVYQQNVCIDVLGLAETVLII